MLNAICIVGYLSLLGYILATLKKNRGKLMAQDQLGKSKWVTLAGLLASLTALLHSAPVFLPVVGMALSPLSSIPIIIGALFFADRAFPMFLAATAILFLINAQEATIFLLATGPLGLAASLAVIPNIPFWQKSLINTLLLTFGILLLVFLIGLPGLQNIVGLFDAMTFFALVLFSLVYSTLFMGIALFAQKRIQSIFTDKFDVES